MISNEITVLYTVLRIAKLNELIQPTYVSDIYIQVYSLASFLICGIEGGERFWEICKMRG